LWLSCHCPSKTILIGFGAGIGIAIKGISPAAYTEPSSGSTYAKSTLKSFSPIISKLLPSI
jgi:hypothetical protein